VLLEKGFDDEEYKTQPGCAFFFRA